MKFGLGYDWKELKRFEKLDKKDRSIVFYLENEYYFIFFQPIIEKLPDYINIVPKIESLAAVLNIKEICDSLKTEKKIVMLDMGKIFIRR